LACHDEDGQNANLARNLWVENGLDVPETFLSDMILYLGKITDISFLTSDDCIENLHTYVRQSCAQSLSESLEIWPTNTAIVLETLKEYYRTKVYPFFFVLSSG
jgi:hypothetical protein